MDADRDFVVARVPGTHRGASPMRYWRRPLDLDRVTIPHGEVRILRERCKGCGFCVEYCPKDVLALSEEFNQKGYHPPEVVDADGCVNCHLCEMICPDFAIYSVPLPDRPVSLETTEADSCQPVWSR